jgi:hypothetical protein
LRIDSKPVRKKGNKEKGLKMQLDLFPEQAMKAQRARFKAYPATKTAWRMSQYWVDAIALYLCERRDWSTNPESLPEYIGDEGEAYLLSKGYRIITPSEPAPDKPFNSFIDKPLKRPKFRKTTKPDFSITIEF